ncbi:MAG: DUF1549 and DUF1553 domain-containing protein [Planctomycetota bacterium]
MSRVSAGLLTAALTASMSGVLPQLLTGQGPATATTHWAFTAPRRFAAPSVRDHERVRDVIDAFVLAALERDGLGFAEEAERRILIRRLSLDLLGLPPTTAEIADFLADSSPTAYESLVDRWLEREEFGEAMALDWLDAVRFADTNGIHHDHYREVSAYRDWVIRAFAENLPYDRFVSAQIAGDLLPEGGRDGQIASGFLRLHRIIDVGTALPEESHANNVIDRVTAVGTAFLGLTLHCAACHDHKYDPVRQREFYGLFALFNNLDGAPETGGRSGTDFLRGLQPPYIDLPSAEQAAALADHGQRLATLRDAIAALEKTPAQSRDAAVTARLQEAKESHKRIAAERDRVLMDVPAALVMRERAELREAFVLDRGDYQRPGAKVERHTPAFLPPLRTSGPIPTRLDLANWLVSPEHPLTARVFVNRVWQHFFGCGLVKTAEDLGTQGELPSHPEVLDELAIGFVESGYDVKALVRRIVRSTTYRQSSSAAAAAFALDPENRRLARGPRVRLPAEVIRDQVLAASGRLDRTRFGKSVKVPQPPGLWEAVALPDSYPRVHVADPGTAIYRRSIYTFWKRGLPPPQMTILDAPARESCVARRERTNTPQQALLLLNEPEYLGAAAHLAATLVRDGGSDGDRIDAVFEIFTARRPSTAVHAELAALLQHLRATYAADEIAARAVSRTAHRPADSTASDAAEHAAWTLLVSTIQNLELTRTKD